MQMNDKTIEKLRKLLRLAGDKAATQGEIEAAMAAAKRIAMENSIELGSVDMSDTTQRKQGVDVTQDTGLQIKAAFERKYHAWVFHIVQKMFGVRCLTERQKQGSRYRITKVWIIGDPTDVEITKAVFGWLEDLYPKSFLQAVNAFQVMNDAASQHGYYRGLTAGILDANKREEDQVLKVWQSEGHGAASKYAMVVRDKTLAIDKFVEREHPDLKKTEARSVQMSNTAAELGYAKGKTIKLNQVGSGSTARGALR